jgi:hypothetical protein
MKNEQLQHTTVDAACIDSIPNPPADVVSRNNSGAYPRGYHRAALPDVVDELARFDDFAEVFGKTVPSLVHVRQRFEEAHRWSSRRTKAALWERYCLCWEGIVWEDLRALMARMKPAFDLAVAQDESIAHRFPALVRLFAGASALAKRSAAVRKANDALEAAGELPAKGEVGKRRRRAAALAEKDQATQRATDHQQQNGVSQTGRV